MKTRIAKGKVSTNQSKMGNKAQEKKQVKEENTFNNNNNNKKKEVLISVYVESPSLPLIQAQHKAKRSSISGSPQTSNPRAYDRRAQLLAYAQELRRNTNDKRPQFPKNDLKPMPKENLKNSLELKRTSDEKSPTRVRRRKRYQRLVPEVDISCRPRSTIIRKNNRAKWLTDFRFMGKLRMILRGFCKK